MTLPIINTGGEERKLGLLQPSSPPTLYQSLSDAVGVLSPEEIRKLVDDPKRVSGRKLFDEYWTKDQNGRGACQGYASAGAVERARVRRGLDHVALSGDWAYCLVNGGNDQGSHLEAGMKAAEKYGYCSQETVERLGLRHEYRRDKFPVECQQEATRFRGFECYAVKTEQELQTACALLFDVVVAVHAGGNDSLDKHGICNWGNGPGNHAVLVDDLIYDRELGGYKYDHQNSWSTAWGDNGRSYLTFDRHFKQSIGIHLFYAIRSTSDDPQGDNPPEPKE